MFRTLRQAMPVALAILCIVFTVTRAADATLLGTVQNVDPQQGRLTVKAGEDHVVELRAPAELLTDLQSGDVVEVQRSGQQATYIRRQEGRQRPDLGGALQLQPPVEMPKSR